MKVAGNYERDGFLRSKLQLVGGMLVYYVAFLNCCGVGTGVSHFVEALGLML